MFCWPRVPERCPSGWLEPAGASRAGLGIWVWKTWPRLFVSAGTVRHMCKNRSIMRDSIFWHEKDVSQACVGSVMLLALQKANEGIWLAGD